MKSMIRDIKLAPSGHDKIAWVKNFMPVLNSIDKEFSVKKPFAGKKFVVTMHLEAKTAYLALVLHRAGAEVAGILQRKGFIISGVETGLTSSREKTTITTS